MTNYSFGCRTHNFLRLQQNFIATLLEVTRVT